MRDVHAAGRHRATVPRASDRQVQRLRQVTGLREVCVQRRWLLALDGERGSEQRLGHQLPTEGLTESAAFAAGPKAIVVEALESQRTQRVLE